jgi:hypothetical protein
MHIMHPSAEKVIDATKKRLDRKKRLNRVLDGMHQIMGQYCALGRKTPIQNLHPAAL